MSLWFCVSVFFEGTSSEPTEAALWENVHYLVEAGSDTEAVQKAATIAKSKEHSYETATGATLSWRLVHVEKVYQIDDGLVDGAELFSRFLRDGEVKSILEPIDG